MGVAPSYYRVGEGFQNRYGVCRVFGARLAEPYKCFDWLWKEEPSIWRDKTNGTFDCSTINDKLYCCDENSCCEIAGALVKWRNLSTGFTCYFSLQKKEGSKWVTKPIWIGREVYEFEIDIPDPHDCGYSYWLWAAAVFWVGTWKNNWYYEITGDGQYRIKVREKNGKFSPVYMYFNVVNLRHMDLKFTVGLKVNKPGSYYVGAQIVDVTDIQWKGPYNLSKGDHKIELTLIACPVSGKARVAVADSDGNILDREDVDYDFEQHHYG